MSRNAYQIAGSRSGRFSAIAQQGSILNQRIALDTYIIALAASADDTEETIDITAIPKYANVYRTMASNNAMVSLQNKNKQVVVNEKLSPNKIINGGFDDSGNGWTTVGESTVNTGVGRIYSTGATSYISWASAMGVGLFYKCNYKVIGIPSGTAQLGNLANYGRINSSNADSDNTRRFVSADSSLIFKRVTACDASVDDIDLREVINMVMTNIGDSITSDPSYVGKVRNAKHYWSNNWAVGTSTIISDFSTQVANAVNDNADIIIIALGTNDDNFGNMVALQSAFESGISTLKTTNPNAKIYVMNVLPRWTDTGGGTPVDKSNIRNAISTACASQNVICWDTFSDPWIDASDTVDGLHPDDAGHQKISDRIVALLPSI